MLPSVIPNARILMYNWNANYINGASQDTFSDHANTLLNQLQLEREKAVFHLEIVTSHLELMLE
jgi:hypothetical protein